MGFFFCVCVIDTIILSNGCSLFFELPFLRQYRIGGEAEKGEWGAQIATKMHVA